MELARANHFALIRAQDQLRKINDNEVVRLKNTKHSSPLKTKLCAKNSGYIFGFLKGRKVTLEKNALAKKFVDYLKSNAEGIRAKISGQEYKEKIDSEINKTLQKDELTKREALDFINKVLDLSNASFGKLGNKINKEEQVTQMAAEKGSQPSSSDAPAYKTGDVPDSQIKADDSVYGFANFEVSKAPRFQSEAAKKQEVDIQLDPNAPPLPPRDYLNGADELDLVKDTDEHPEDADGAPTSHGDPFARRVSCEPLYDSIESQDREVETSPAPRYVETKDDPLYATLSADGALDASSAVKTDTDNVAQSLPDTKEQVVPKGILKTTPDYKPRDDSAEKAKMRKGVSFDDTVKSENHIKKKRMKIPHDKNVKVKKKHKS